MLLKINSVHARNMKFGTNLPCEKFYKADQAILNLFISDILWANMCPKIAAKNQNFQNRYILICGMSYKEGTCQIISSLHVWCPNKCSV